MIIENAERFGLSQLHQLRGRVGRGADQSYCILIADYAWFDRSRRGEDGQSVVEEKQNARKRLETMVETTDGFRIAEVDLELRGPGEFFGTRQSGLPQFKLANLVLDGEILTLARKSAFRLIETDPHLRLPANRRLREEFGRQYADLSNLASVG
jgi:ATP-dependent DNA helicase RecG